MKENTLILARLGRIFALVCPTLLVAAFVAGCGGSGSFHSTKAPTITMTASPTSITAGGTSTLTVTATNATTVTIAGGTSTYTMASTGGTQSVTPTATTTYTATAANSEGTVTATAVVTVGASQPTVTIGANPASITAGATSTLTVAATNATAVTIAGSDGTSYTLTGTSGGTQTVTPSVTTTYTATATGASGTTAATAKTTVTVTANVAAPTVMISASPTSISAGMTSTLTVAATNATTVTIAGSDGSSYTLAKAAGGTQVVTPAATTTYTATATGASGTTPATQKATVTVTANPNAPTVTITAKPTSIVAGGSSVLTVVATQATAVTIAGSDGSTYTLSGTTGGTQSVTPTATTTYTATATGTGSLVATAATIVTVTAPAAPTVTIAASPATIHAGDSSTLTIVATNATGVTVTGTDNSSQTLPAAGGTATVTPGPTDTTSTTYTYTATATGGAGTTPATATATVTVNPSANVQQSIKHVIFELQENHTFDNYFGMLNVYRKSNSSPGADGATQPWNVGDDGNTYNVDGIDTSNTVANINNIKNEDDEGDVFTPFKLTSTCVDDESSGWIASFGDVNRYDFQSNRTIGMDGFVHNAEGYDNSCKAIPPSTVSNCPGGGDFTDPTGERSMGYYDQEFLNYYYYMASQFAVSDRWFSPVASKSADNRIATLSGGTTQGLVQDPGSDDHLQQLNLPSIFQALQKANVSWKIYYTVTQSGCQVGSTNDNDGDCPTTQAGRYPATWFTDSTYSFNFLRENAGNNAANCATVTTALGNNLQASSVEGDETNSFCVDSTHIAPIWQYYTDLANNTLPAFSFIEAGYSNNDEHPGSGQAIVQGQNEVSKLMNAFMNSSSWSNSVFFFAYDEGGGPYDHVPPVPNHSNDKTDIASLGYIAGPDHVGSLAAPPDIASISVNPDPPANPYFPCLPAGDSPTAKVPATTHCDLEYGWPGVPTAPATSDVVTEQGFGAQLGFRLPNMVLSPFTRRHYVSHIPMDHTAVIKFVEDLFIGNHVYLTKRDAAQPDLLDFFDFNNVPWATPPTGPTPNLTSACTPGSYK
jgi:phospholipase C